MQYKIVKKISVSSLIAFELVALSTPFYLETIFVIVGQCVNKKSQDSRY